MQNIGFFKRIQINLSNFYKNLIKSNDFKAGKEMIYEIVLSGILINLGITLMGSSFGIVNLLACGSAFYIFSNKLVDIIVRVLSSIKIVQITR